MCKIHGTNSPNPPPPPTHTHIYVQFILELNTTGFNICPDFQIFLIKKNLKLAGCGR
jgi:hypothetical protein